MGKLYYCEKKGYNDINIIGLYMNEISKIRVLSQEEIIELFKKARNGDNDARNKIIEHNLKLVAYIAKLYKDTDMPLLDAVQAGNEALIRCVNNYKVDSGVKFSSYLFKCVIFSIRRAQDNLLSIISIPVYVHDKLSSIKNYCSDFLMKNQKEATDEEIIRDMGVNKEIVNLYRLLSDRSNFMNVDELINFEGEDLNYPKVYSRDAVVGVEDKNLELAVEKIDDESMLDYIMNSSINDRAKKVLLYRYGFIDGCKHSFRDMEKLFGISYEGIRQTEERAFRRFRNSKMLKRYKY